MELHHFHQRRTAIQANGRPGQPSHLQGMQDTLREVLMSSGLFEDVEVEHTENRDALVIALCSFRHLYTELDIAERLENLWSDLVRFPFWEAHAVLTHKDHVELEAASALSPAGHYVTVHLVAEKARIPEQRSPR